MILTPLQEAALDYSDDECKCGPGEDNDGDCVANALQNGFMAGAKWMEEHLKNSPHTVLNVSTPDIATLNVPLPDPAGKE